MHAGPPSNAISRSELHLLELVLYRPGREMVGPRDACDPDRLEMRAGAGDWHVRARRELSRALPNAWEAGGPASPWGAPAMHTARTLRLFVRWEHALEVAAEVADVASRLGLALFDHGAFETMLPLPTMEPTRVRHGLDELALIEDGYLVIETEDDSGLYVQVLLEDGRALLEGVSSRHLPQPLSAATVRRLERIGLEPPNERSDNHHRAISLGTAGARLAASGLVSAVHEAYGAPTPLRMRIADATRWDELAID